MADPPTHYDAAMAVAELGRTMIRLHHYLRHIELNKDAETAKIYRQEIYKLEDHARRVSKNTS